MNNRNHRKRIHKITKETFTRRPPHNIPKVKKGKDKNKTSEQG